jgi:SPOR domain
MARAVLRDIVFGLATTGLLLGCVESGGKTGTGESAGLAAAPGKKKSGQEVEAPEVFQATDSALWDGRPSLGGIWVASPDVENPERVVMFNPATGKTVTGALFKRERDNPGPKMQLSSDAAEALGILAGAPTEIRVTALRKEEAAEDPVAKAAPDATATDPAAEPTKDGDAAAIASAALAAVEGDTKPADTDTDTAAASADPAAQDADPAAAAAAGAAVVAADGAAAVVDQTPTKKTWKERRAEAKAAREAKRKAAAEAKAAAAAAATGAAVAPDGEAPTASPDAAAAAIAPIESAPLDARNPDAVTPDAGAPAETPKSKRKTVGDTAAAAPVEAEAPAPEAPAATGPARPIQVASFSKEDNAKRAAEALAKIGVTATPQKSDKAGKAVWGVVVMGDEAMLKKIKDAGFADAYFLK